MFDFAMEALIDRRRASRGDRVRLVEQQHGLLLAGAAEHGGDVLRRFAHPHRFELGVADDQQAAAERVRDRFGADRLAGSRWAREVERQREPGRVTLTETPAIEDQVVARHLDERLIERAARRRRKDDVGERPPRDERFDGPPGGTFAEEPGERRQRSHCILLSRTRMPPATPRPH